MKTLSTSNISQRNDDGLSLRRHSTGTAEGGERIPPFLGFRHKSVIGAFGFTSFEVLLIFHVYQLIKLPSYCFGSCELQRGKEG